MRIPSIPNRTTQIPYHAEHSKASGSQKRPPVRRAGGHVESVLAAPCRGSFLSVQAIILLSADRPFVEHTFNKYGKSGRQRPQAPDQGVAQSPQPRRDTEF